LDTRTSSSASSLVSLARRDSLPTWSFAVKPPQSAGTRNPRMELGSSSPAVFAQTTARSAVDPFVIHILVPLRIHASPSLRAVVINPPGLEP
jgi:hypothetical protein